MNSCASNVTFLPILRLSTAASRIEPGFLKEQAEDMVYSTVMNQK